MERDRESGIEINRIADTEKRQRDRDTQRQKERKTNRQRDRERKTNRQRDKEAGDVETN